MRSIIEEIAAAEQKADEIRAASLSEGRERVAKAGEETEKAFAALEAGEREALAAALSEAEKNGENIAREMAEKLNAEADALCDAAKARIPAAVDYLLKRVQKLA